MRSPPTIKAPLATDGPPTHHLPDKALRLEILGLPPNTPQFLLDDFVPHDVKKSYWSVQAERDRRLRCLIRRYFNQIQYGCKNHNCSTPTCLSYRRRNTKVPLRRYTDLGARTLACHLVDDCTQQKKDPSLGLCSSEPVVPWNVDLGAKRWNILERHVERHSQELANGHVLEPPRRAMRRSSPTSPKILPFGGSQEPGRRGFREVITVPCEENISSIDTPKVMNVEKAHNLEDEAFHDEVRQDRPAALALPPKKDTASFTQSIWDLFALRKLTVPNDEPPPAVADSPRPPVEQETGKTTSVPEAHRENRSEHLGFGSATSCGFMLQRLSWETLKWLCLTQKERGIWFSWNPPFEEFLKQSVYHNLSSPIRILRTTRDWSESRDEALCGVARAQPSCMVNHDCEKSMFGNFGGYEQCRSTEYKDFTQPKPLNGSLDSSRVMFAFNMVLSISSTTVVFDALYESLQKCYALPLTKSSEYNVNDKLRKHLERQPRGLIPNDHWLHLERSIDQPLNDSQVTETFLMVLIATSGAIMGNHMFLFGPGDSRYSVFFAIKNGISAYPGAPFGDSSSHDKDGMARFRGHLMRAVEICEDWYFVRLLTSLMHAISHRLAAQAITRIAKRSKRDRKRSVIEMLIQKLHDSSVEPNSKTGVSPRVLGLSVVDNVRLVLLKSWNREAVVKRTSAVGGALELLSGLFRRHTEFGMEAHHFNMHFVADAFDSMEMPFQWLSFRPDGRDVHILSCSFLFHPATLVKYFRSINVETMRKSHEAASLVYNDTRQFLTSMTIPVLSGREVLTDMRPFMNKYFVLTIRRTSVLSDAIDQMWRRQRRELMRPLRVRLGKDEGEDGLDHGGVQQEFFRLAFAEALNPEFGMFAVDETTRMVWFQAGSLEPLFKFEALGMLMSLAIYNGVTLPITFPLAFYRKLLGLKVKKLEHIEDGWPDLKKGLRFLLDCDGDVSDVIARTYEFSYEFAGNTVTVDMGRIGRDDHWPPMERASRKGKEKAKSTSFELPVPLNITPPSHSPPLDPLRMSRQSSFRGVSTPLSIESDVLDEAATVTNKNREQYVKDYIFWLTDKSIRGQYEAFARGFFTCVDSTALSMFTPEALKNVVEGYREIVIDELEATTTYEEYNRSSQTVIDFWDVVRNFSPEQHRHLLEFVTASDRIPVSGISSIHFIIQRNGDDDARLPSSSTCYGRLLLPEYSSKAILETKLSKAMENSMGFGAL